MGKPQTKEQKIKFNNGFVTALAMFYGHVSQAPMPGTKDWDCRLYAATDHLLDIEYPANLDKKLKRKIQVFVSKVIRIRLKLLTTEEVDKLFERCLELLMEIDRKYFGLEVEALYP